MAAPSKRLVILGDPLPGNPATPIAQGLREKGWTVMLAPESFASSGRATLARIIDRLQLSLQRWSAERALLDVVREVRPQVLLLLKAVWVRQATVAAAQAMGTRVVTWWPDYHFNHPPFDEQRFGTGDLTITTKFFQLDYLREKFPHVPAVYVEHGYCPGVHRAIALPGGPTHDVVYLGNHSAYKGRLLRDFALAAPELSIAVAGGRWVGAGPWPDNVQFFPAQPQDLLAAFLARGRVALAFHMGPTGNGWADQVSARTFEIPACALPMVHIDNPTVREWFEPGAEFLPFSNIPSMVEAVRLLLGDPEKRSAIAAAGHARAVPAYSYTERGHAIAEIIEREFGLGPA